ncbi:19394_t:CDS:2 [Dentiscutata erythropus]|uniref:19394_t:CDS:1 n=1 Tax=Dentiscutata erythropus TaxID=1348616 RepID=A0A9N9DH09_9GLOM|nr:19394_t:CDS:2 [Dentiscutata erythropus]
MSNFQDTRKDEKFYVPSDKIPFLIGKKGANINKIKEKSGAKIFFIESGSGQHIAKIQGTPSQRSQAKSLIQESLERLTVIPTIGYVLLEVDELTDVKEANYRFVEFKGDDANEHSRGLKKYFVERIQETEKTSKVNDVMDDLANQLRHGILLPSLKTGDFTTSDKLDECLEVISSKISDADPTFPEGKEIRLNIFFGRQLFTRIDKIKDLNFDVHDWCGFERNQKFRLSTSFQHNAPQIIEKMPIIQKKFGLQEKPEAITGNKGSITVYYSHNEKKRKFKLHWNADKGLWELTKAVKDIRRHAIMDFVSGSQRPDLRFLLKTQCNHHIDNKLEKIIQDLQSINYTDNGDEMYFHEKDFTKFIDCVGVRQTVRKLRYSNDKFQVTCAIICQDMKGKFSKEEFVSVKNLAWRQVENIDKSPMQHFDEEEVIFTIRDTIEFARKIARIIA